MANLTAASLALKIRTLLGEANDYNVATNELQSDGWFDDSMVIDSINYAVREYARRKRVTFAVQAVTISAGGLVTIPEDQLDVIQVGVSSSLLIETSYQQESGRDPGWEDDTALAAKKWMIQDGATIRLAPIVAAWSLGPYTANVGYIQAPKFITTLGSITAGSFAVNQWYQILAVGSTTWTSIGASASTVGIQFKATGVGSGTGTAYETVDNRVKHSDQDSLKYAAASFLLQMLGTPQDVAKSEKYDQIFNALIGA